MYVSAQEGLQTLTGELGCLRRVKDSSHSCFASISSVCCFQSARLLEWPSQGVDRSLTRFMVINPQGHVVGGLLVFEDGQPEALMKWTTLLNAYSMVSTHV